MTFVGNLLWFILGGWAMGLSMILAGHCGALRFLVFRLAWRSSVCLGLAFSRSEKNWLMLKT